MKKEYLGVIFDLDGVIVSTDEYHYKAWKALADKLDIEFDRQINNRLRGVSRRESLMIILEKSDKEYSEEEILSMLEEKNNLYVQFLKELTEEDILSGVEETLSYLKEKQIKTAIGSSSRNAPRILNQINRTEAFDAIIDGNQISKSKPDPEVFIKAAKAIGLRPDQVLVVEDALAGVESAKNGHMDVLYLGNETDKGDYNYVAPDLAGMIIKELI